MKISPRVFSLALALALFFSVSGGLVFAQADARKAFSEGMEDLQNNLVRDAITKLESALAAAQSGSNPLPDSDAFVVQTRYAYGYALSRDRRFFDAIPELDVLVESKPDMTEAKYLLAVTLVRTMSNENVIRGMALLKQLADSSTNASGRTIAVATAVQLGFNISTAEYAAGDPAAAAKLVDGMVWDYGQDPAPDQGDNQDLSFAFGVYLKDSGEVESAILELDALAAGGGQDYALNNGTTLAQVRADAYYSAAINRLEAGGAEGGKGALEMIGQLENLEGSETPNKNFNTHAKALAYSMIGDTEAMKREMETLKASNAAYFNSVTN